MEKVKKNGFFRKLKNSIFSFDSYQEFATESWKSGILYILKLVLLVSIILGIAISIVQVTRTIPDLFNYIRNDLPDFNYSEGKLEVKNENKVLIENDSQIVIADTGEISEEKINEYKEKINLYSIGVFITKNKIYVKSPVKNGEMEEMNISDLLKSYEIDSFNKEKLVNQVNSINMVSLFISLTFAVFIIAFMMLLTYLILDVIILALLVNIFAMILGVRMKASACFNIAIHSLTLPLILLLMYQIVLLTIGFEIKYFSIMYRGISYIYAFTALILIRSTLIKQKIELTAIIQKQKEIKENMEKQEKDKKENEDTKENKKDEKKQEEKEDKDDKEDKEDKENVGNEANGEV